MKGSKAPDAGGELHSSYKESFFAAEISKVNDWKELKTEAAIREAGRMKTKYADYVMESDDVAIFI